MRVAQLAAVGIAAGAACGALLWARAAGTTPDPYDSGLFWQVSLLSAFAIGAVVADRNVAGLAGAAHVVYPVWWTFTETSDSPFGPLGVVFLVAFAGVVALPAFLGAWLRRRVAPPVGER